MILFFTFIIFWIIASIRVNREFNSTVDSDWLATNEPKQWWLFIAIYGFWPIGFLFYFFKVRQKVLKEKSKRLSLRNIDDSYPITSELKVVEEKQRTIVKESVFDLENSTPKYEISSYE